ncbi:hypothetical protein [Roseomonas sp. BN140053]|uniref:hypothetical protein n=1 Tax=Roseomonas sp. BN140053 TaxID=3391898 RepID=UPI0039E96A17
MNPLFGPEVAFLVLPPLVCLGVSLLLRVLLRRYTDWRHPGASGVLISLAATAVLIFALRDYGPPSFPVNGPIEAFYIAILFHIPPVAWLTWRATLHS